MFRSFFVGGCAAFALCVSSAVAQQPTPAGEGAAVVEHASAVQHHVHVQHAAPVAPAAECCPIGVVRERYALSAKRKLRCGCATQQVLCVDNPADCCCKNYAVTLCVPACCSGEPVCCGTRVGLLGRGYVTYRWPSGYEATIAFRVHGGVIVNYR